MTIRLLVGRYSWTEQRTTCCECKLLWQISRKSGTICQMKRQNFNRMKVDYLESFQRGSAEPQLKAKTVFIKDFVQHLEETLVSIAREIEQIDKLRADIKSRYAELLGQFNKYKALKSRATSASRKEQLSLENKEQDMRNVLRFSEKST